MNTARKTHHQQEDDKAGGSIIARPGQQTRRLSDPIGEQAE
jgi:hypothetical protein